MRIFIFSAALLIMGAGCVSRPVATPSTGPNLELEQTGLLRKQTVVMTEQGFDPAELTVKKDESVTFANSGSEDHWPASAIHPIHDRYPEFDPKRGIPAGESWAFTFDRAGSWGYHDHLSPGLRGKIVVTE